MTATASPVPRDAPTSLPVRLFSVAEYHWAVLMIAEGLLRGRLPEGWRVCVQSAITTTNSEPDSRSAVRGFARFRSLSCFPEESIDP